MSGGQLKPGSVSPRVEALLREAKEIAREYYELTGKPLGITGEIAEYEAARILGLELSPARQTGYDAVRLTDGGEQMVQIKGRLLTPTAKPGQRLGRIDLEKDWDVVLLVLLDQRYEPTAIYEADRAAVTSALTSPGSKSRNVRGQLSVSKFKSIGRQLWQS